MHSLIPRVKVLEAWGSDRAVRAVDPSVSVAAMNAHPPAPEAPPVAVRPARDHCLAPGRAEDPPGAGRYGRLFAELEPVRAGEAFFADQGRRAVAGEASPFVDLDDVEGASDASVPAGGRSSRSSSPTT